MIRANTFQKREEVEEVSNELFPTKSSTRLQNDCEVRRTRIVCPKY